MTFLCKDCAVIMNIPSVEIRTFRDYGACERCGEVGYCSDIHHSHFPEIQSMDEVKNE